MSPVLVTVLDPAELVAVSETEKVPAEEYTCDGFRLVSAGLPSPKSHDHAVGDPEDESVN